MELNYIITKKNYVDNSQQLQQSVPTVLFKTAPIATCRELKKDKKINTCKHTFCVFL